MTPWALEKIQWTFFNIFQQCSSLLLLVIALSVDVVPATTDDQSKILWDPDIC